MPGVPAAVDMLRVTVIPAAYAAFYAIRGPVEGAARGITGHNTPIGYRELAKIYPHKVEPTGLDYKKGDERDPVAAFGAAWPFITGTATSAPFWAIARTGRALFYDIPRELKENFRND